jgi:hypothetical protein
VELAGLNFCFHTLEQGRVQLKTCMRMSTDKRLWKAQKLCTCSSHLNCWAWLAKKRCSGYRSTRSTCVDNDRETFCWVTR